MQPFTKRVIEIIQSIPEGRVMTYGQIARIAGSPRGARQVVRILHSMSKKYNLPWHRVINGKGELSRKNEEMFEAQRRFLEEEGIVFQSENKIDLKSYGFEPVIF